jgi:hypothetical protein
MLYIVHDRIYLWIKGYFIYRWSWFVPVFVLFGFLGALFLSFWLIGKSVVRRLHIRVLKVAVSFSQLHHYLVAGARAMGTIGSEPEMIRIVVQHEWRIHADNLGLSASSQPSHDDAEHLLRLTTLLHSLNLLVPSSPSVDSYLLTYEYVQKAYFMLIFHDEEECAYTVMKQMRPNEDWLEVSVNESSSFGYERVLRDFYLLGLARHPQLADDWVLTDGPKWRDSAANLLLASLSDRCRELERWIGTLEAKGPDTGVGSSVGGAGADPDHAFADGEHLASVGRLAAGVSLHTAYDASATELGLRFMDSLETARFLVALARPIGDSTGSGLALHIRSLLTSTPGPFERSIAAHCLSLSQKRRALEWSQTSFAKTDEKLVRKTDEHLVASRTAALILAAGPEYWPDDRDQ